MSLTISDVKILRGKEIIDGAISIQNGRISKIGKKTVLEKADTRIDGKGLIAIPGLIDAHVHLRDMDLAYKEDFSSGTQAAAAGGFTTVLDMPNTKPPTSSSERLLDKIAKARNAIHVDVGFYALLTESADELRRMAHAGATAFKLYMNDPESDAWHRDQKRLLSSLEACASLGQRVACHAEAGARTTRIQTKLQASGRNSPRDFLRAHAPRFEVEAVHTIISLARRARSRVHLCHLSTRRGLEEISRARETGLPITCEVTPHHLFLNREDLNRKRGIALMLPPLRGTSDVESLWKSTLSGRVDIVASDHAPHTLEEKAASDIWAVRPGIPGLETTLPLLLTMVHRKEINLCQLVRLLAENPSRIFGLKGKGRLVAGMDGDVVLIDPKERFRIDSSRFFSKARFSPFDGLECVGRPVMTIVSGYLVYDRGEILEKNCGKVLTRGVRPRDSS